MGATGGRGKLHIRLYGIVPPPAVLPRETNVKEKCWVAKDSCPSGLKSVPPSHQAQILPALQYFANRHRSKSEGCLARGLLGTWGGDPRWLRLDLQSNRGCYVRIIDVKPQIWSYECKRMTLVSHTSANVTEKDSTAKSVLVLLISTTFSYNRWSSVTEVHLDALGSVWSVSRMNQHLYNLGNRKCPLITATAAWWF